MSDPISDRGRAPLIRDAVAADRAGMRALYVTVWTATYRATLGAAVLRAMLDDLRRSDMGCMLPGEDERAAVAVRAGRVVGSAIMAERRGVAYLWGMYVAPRWQRCGIGGALLRHAAGWLTAEAVIEARVMPTSPWAQQFYARHGFCEAGREKLEVAPGHWLESIVLRGRITAA